MGGIPLEFLCLPEVKKFSHERLSEFGCIRKWVKQCLLNF